MNRVIAYLALLLALLLALDSLAQSFPCEQYRTIIARSAYKTFGPDAPVADLTAQAHQESGCKPDAKSKAGAQGLTQFMPATAADMAARHPDVCAPAQPFSPVWSIRCRDRYMREQLQRFADAATESDQWAFALSAYNGGAGWVNRDKLVCTKAPPFTCPICDPLRWWDNVELSPDLRRSPANIRENRGYPKRIMCVIAPRYAAAGYGRMIGCPTESQP